MLELALRWGQEITTMKELARRQDIPEKYIWHILRPLVVAGLVKTARGPAGGYALARPPADITVHDVLEPLEGPAIFIECLADLEACDKTEDCAARDMWGEVGRRINHALGSITLQDMVKKHHRKHETVFNYSI